MLERGMSGRTSPCDECENMLGDSVLLATKKKESKMNYNLPYWHCHSTETPSSCLLDELGKVAPKKASRTPKNNP